MSISRTAVVVLLALAPFPQIARSDSAPQESSQSGETKSAPERLAADTPRITPGGATFTVAAGWSIVNGKDLVILEPPETDTHIAIVDSQAPDASAAVAASWAAFKPEEKRPVRLVTPLPPREGWDDRQVISYETSPNERAVVEAIALRAGSTWTVFIIEASQPTLEKRAAQVELVLERPAPEGLQARIFCGPEAATARRSAHRQDQRIR
jgi:hypothetical protein